MSTWRAVAVVVALALPPATIPYAQQRTTPPSSRAATLTALDYAEIERLSNRYVWAIDACTNAGYDFADLFTEDGEFGLSEEFGAPATRARTKGREALASVAGGDSKGGCRDPKTMLGYGISHFVVNLVITPAPGGATGKSYLLAIGVGGDPTRIERQGGYEDVYVKTAAGWRFKSRTHVFPNMAGSVQFGGGRRGQAGSPQSNPSQPGR